MIQLAEGATQYVYVTLTEKELLTNPNYLWVFTNREKNTVTKFIKLNNTDVSAYKERYNKFEFVVPTLFNPTVRGEYKYEVYEQMSTSNLDPTGLNLLETGIMKITEARTVYTERSATNEFIVND